MDGTIKVSERAVGAGRRGWPGRGREAERRDRPTGRREPGVRKTWPLFLPSAPRLCAITSDSRAVSPSLEGHQPGSRFWRPAPRTPQGEPGPYPPLNWWRCALGCPRTQTGAWGAGDLQVHRVASGQPGTPAQRRALAGAADFFSHPGPEGSWVGPEAAGELVAGSAGCAGVSGGGTV